MIIGNTIQLAPSLAALALSLFIIQPAKGTSWVTNSPLIAARWEQTATLLSNGKVLVAGGKGNSGSLASAELYDPTTGTWATTGPLTTARYVHAATMLPNGKVLVAGGYDSNSISSAELYDPASGTWTTTGSLTTKRMNHTLTLLSNGKVLVAGGYNDNSLASAELYDPATGTWTETGALISPRNGHTATLLPNGKVLVAGGGNSGRYLFHAELFDPTTGTWTATGPLTIARAGHTATLLPNGEVVVAGGDNGNISFSSAELYDPATGRWRVTGPLTTARYVHRATLLPDGKVLIEGGYNRSSGYPISAELYDPATGTWTATDSLTDARAYHTATLLPNGKVLVAGGDNGPNALSSVELYDSASGAWRATGPLTTAHGQHTATLLPNGKVLVAGGLNGTGVSSSSAEVFDPASDKWTTTGALTTARRYHTATLLSNGRVLVAGGVANSANAATTNAEMYDAATGTWTATGALTTARGCHTATLLPNGKVLVAGGLDGTNALPSVELYDPAAGTWTATGPLTDARYVHTATLLPSGKVLVAGGSGTGVSVSSAELYDPATGTWTATAPLTNARYTHTAALLPSGKVLVAGGTTNYGYDSLSSAELYDPTTETWTATGTLTTARWGHTATVLSNGKMLVAGGWYISSAELYDPATGTWMVTGALTNARVQQTATLLPNGKVLVAGGRSGGSRGFSSAELYDIGLGFSASWQPQMASVTSPLSLGGSLVLTGSGFRGVSGGSGGTSQDSPGDYPLVQLCSLESGQTMFLLSTNWSTNSFTSLPVTSFWPGYALVTVFVNGIPSISGVVNITVPVLMPIEQPAIMTHPVSQVINAGNGCTFSVGTIGTEPLYYQWFQGVYLLHSPTGTSLVWNAVQPSDAGNFTVVVTNAYGAVTSAPVILTVTGNPPVFTLQPHDQHVKADQSLAISTPATGWEPISYQWFFNDSPLASANQFELSIGSVQLTNSGRYWLLASNCFGVSTSATATVTVFNPLKVTTVKTTNQIQIGQGLTLQATVEGEGPFQYQWQVNGEAIPGATKDTYPIPNIQPKDGGSYRVLAANAAEVVAADIAEVVVTVPLAPAGDNFAQRVALAGTDGVLRSTNKRATIEPDEPEHAGKRGGHSIWFKWIAPAQGNLRFSTAGSSFDTLLGIYTGSEVPSLKPVANDEDRGGYLTSQTQLAVKAGVEYQIAIDGFAEAVGSVVLAWEFEPTPDVLPQVTLQPQSQMVASGSGATLGVQATGENLRYQWYQNGGLIPGATNRTLVLTNVGSVQVGGYVVQVINATGTKTNESPVAFIEVYQVVEGQVANPALGQDKLQDLTRGGAGMAMGAKAADMAKVRTAPLAPWQVIRAAGLPPVSGYTVSRWGDTRFDTTQLFENQGKSVISGHSRWQALEVPYAGICTLHTTGSEFDTVLEVVRMDGASLVRVAYDDNSGADGKTSWLQFEANPDEEYYVRVAGVGQVKGNYQLTEVLEVPQRYRQWEYRQGEGYIFTLAVPKAMVFRVDGSQDLRQWERILSTNSVTGLYEFRHSDNLRYDHRFYRAVLFP